MLYLPLPYFTLLYLKVKEGLPSSKSTQLVPAGGTLAEIGRAGGEISFYFLFYLLLPLSPFSFLGKKNKVATDPNRAGGETRTARSPFPPLSLFGVGVEGSE